MRAQDPLVCSCLAVSESEVRQAIRDGASTLKAVGERCEAGTGCQTCHEAIHCLLREDAARALASDRAPDTLRQLSLFDPLIDGARPRAPQGSHRRPSE